MGKSIFQMEKNKLSSVKINDQETEALLGDIMEKYKNTGYKIPMFSTETHNIFKETGLNMTELEITRHVARLKGRPSQCLPKDSIYLKNLAELVKDKIEEDFLNSKLKYFSPEEKIKEMEKLELRKANKNSRDSVLKQTEEELITTSERLSEGNQEIMRRIKQYNQKNLDMIIEEKYNDSLKEDQRRRSNLAFLAAEESSISIPTAINNRFNSMIDISTIKKRKLGSIDFSKPNAVNGINEGKTRNKSKTIRKETEITSILKSVNESFLSKKSSLKKLIEDDLSHNVKITSNDLMEEKSNNNVNIIGSGQKLPSVDEESKKDINEVLPNIIDTNASNKNLVVNTAINYVGKNISPNENINSDSLLTEDEKVEKVVKNKDLDKNKPRAKDRFRKTKKFYIKIEKKPETKQEKLEFYYNSLISKDGSEKDIKSEILSYFETFKNIEQNVFENNILKTKPLELIDDIKAFKKVVSTFDIADAYKDLASNYGMLYNGFDLKNETLYKARRIDKSLNHLDFDFVRRLKKAQE